MENNRMMGLILLVSRADGSYYCCIGFTLHTGQSIDIGVQLTYTREYKYKDKKPQNKGFI